MNIDRLPGMILLVVGIIGVVKSVWGLLQPDTVKRVAAWWLSAVMKVNTLTGCLLFLVALGMWGTILLHQPLAHWLVVAVGLLFAWAASLYLRPAALQRVMKAMILNRGVQALRLMFLVAAAASLLLIWVAVGAL